MEKNFKYKRIIILGGSCSGKSTLADRIGKYTFYPVFHLDALFLDSNWNKKSSDELLKISNNILLNNTGVIDGNYTKFILERIQWADLIIFINVPTLIHLYRMLYRIITIKFFIHNRHGSPTGTKSEFSFNFLLWVINWNRKKKKKIVNLIKDIKDKKVLTIRNPRELNLNELFK